MFENFKLNKISMIALACAVTVLGGGVMTVISPGESDAQPVNRNVVMSDETLELPCAGMGHIIANYVGATSGSSVEFLSTTALASSLGDSFNDYYDANGNTIGKLIVYNGESVADVYNKIQGNERIERGEAVAEVVGHMYAGDVATLVREQELVSDHL